MVQITILGNLTRDPVIKTTAGENPTTVCNFDIASRRKFSTKNGETDTDFFRCTAFGKQAEFIEKYFKKGSRALVIGRVQNNNYTNSNGEKVYGFSIFVEQIDFGSSAPKNHTEDIPTNESEDFTNIPDNVGEGLPFN